MHKEIALTPEGQAKLEDELRHLETVRRREVGERIKEAKEFGDISENSEYDDAKNEQAWVESRIIEINQILAHATIIDAPKSAPTKVTLGCHVTLEEVATGDKHDYQIVGSAEAARTALLSTTTPSSSAGPNSMRFAPPVSSLSSTASKSPLAPQSSPSATRSWRTVPRPKTA